MLPIPGQYLEISVRLLSKRYKSSIPSSSRLTAVALVTAVAAISDFAITHPRLRYALAVVTFEMIVTARCLCGTQSNAAQKPTSMS